MKKISSLGICLLLSACAAKEKSQLITEPETNSEDTGLFGELPNKSEETETMNTSPSSFENHNYNLKTLSNGLQVYTVEKPDIPMVTILIAVKNGAFVETPDIDGLAHLYEHMFFKANEQIPSQAEFIKILDEMGVELGPNMNAYTSTESVRYFYTLQSRYLDRGIEFLADAVKGPKFLQDELKNERKVVIGEFDRYEASPTQVFYQKDVMEKMFSTYFTRKNTIGSRDVILAATPEQMHSIQHRFYIPNNAALFVVGAYDEATLWPSIERNFGTWEEGQDPFVENPIPEHPAIQEIQTFTKNAEVQNANVVQAYQGPRQGIDNKESISFDLLSIMLGREDSAFQKELVHSGLVSSAGFFSWSQRYTSPLFFNLEASSDKAQVAYEKMKNLIERLANGQDISEKDFETAKISTEVRSAYDRESGQHYALGLADVWSSTGALDYYTNYVTLMKSITFDEFKASLGKYLKDKPYVGGALLPEGQAPINFLVAETNQEPNEEGK